MNEIVTFGCRLNFYESELIRDALKKANRDNVTIVHSCAVTNEAERQVKQKIRKIHKQNPTTEIIVVGCAVQLDPTSYIKIPGVAQVLGNDDKLNYKNYLPESKKVIVSDIDNIHKLSPPLINSFADKARAFIEIQNGCNHSCTFCSITHARGSNRSVPIGNIVKQIRIFLEKGYQEIVFTGVDITDFGTDLFGKPSLGLMIKRVLKEVPELKRLRLSSVDIAEVDDELSELITQEPRLMPHLHLSLQSGNNLILKRMKRRHNREQTIKFCQKIKKYRSSVVFGADIIAGFPTESDEMFKDTVNLLEEIDAVYLHVFPYSNRKNTPAEKMPQVPIHVRKERANYLRSLGKIRLEKFNKSLIGSSQNILIEQKYMGRAENFALVKFEHDVDVKEIAKVKIIAADEGYLFGCV